MPTIIALDCSFSMSQPCERNANTTEAVSKLRLAETCCAKIVENILKLRKLEHISILSFSSKVDVVCEFTRDLNALKSSIGKVTLGDKSSVVELFKFINKTFQKEWGCMQPCTIYVLTDGRLSLNDDILNEMETSHSSTLFDFDSCIEFLCVATSQTLSATGCSEALKLILARNEDKGTIHHLIKSQNDPEYRAVARSTAKEIISERFQHFLATVHCGDLKSKVSLFPPPSKSSLECEEFEEILEIVGFLNISDVGNPPVLSRHLILPIEEESKSSTISETGEKSKPCFTVLLHGSLKTENKVALIRASPTSFGMISFWTDNKNKSNLILSIFASGFNCIPWVGDLRFLGPASLLSAPSSGKKGSQDLPTFPVQNKKGVKRSYAQPTVAWTRPTGLQTDVQKILRSVKKLPEKSQVFYKDLNRLRRAALAFGFHELLEGISSLLERECTLLPGTAHPEATLQLSHAARELKSTIHLGYDHTLEPLKTNFGGIGR